VLVVLSGNGFSQFFDASGRRRFAFIFLLLVGAFFRLYALDRYPLGAHQDELSNIYDGWSIAETGADRFGDSHPAVLRAFGERDYRPALYAWLASVPQRFTGFSVSAGRLPAAVLGITSLLLVYGFARDLAGFGYALAALLFAALSPLHIQFSRIAHEGGILPGFFLILILFLWQRGARRNFRIGEVALLGFVTGLSANSYQSTRLTAVLFTLVIGIDILRHASRKTRALLALGCTALLGALPQVAFFLSQPQRFFGRAKVLSVSADTPLNYLATVLHNYWLNLEPHYLFVPRMLRGLTVARLLPVEIVFFYVGLIALAVIPIRPGSRGRVYTYVAFAIAILPAALTTGNPSTMRASGIALVTPLFSAAGLVFLGGLVRNLRLRERLYYPVAVGVVVLAFAAMAYRYASSPYFRELSFQEIGVEMGRKAGAYENRYDAILIESYVSMPYIYVAAFAPISPKEFHRARKELYSIGMDVFTRLGKYYCVPKTTMPRSVAALGHGHGRVLFIAPEKYAGLSQIDSVVFLTQKLYFRDYRIR